MDTRSALRSTSYGPSERIIEDSSIVCGRHRRSRRYVGALSIPMTKPDSRRRPDHLDEQFETVWFVWNPELLSPQKSVRFMLLKACRRDYHAEVVERAIFATPNSLRLHMGPNIKSPFSNIRAITLKLCLHSWPTPVHTHLVPNSRVPFNSP